MDIKNFYDKRQIASALQLISIESKMLSEDRNEQALTEKLIKCLNTKFIDRSTSGCFTCAQGFQNIRRVILIPRRKNYTVSAYCEREADDVENILIKLKDNQAIFSYLRQGENWFFVQA